MEPWYKVATPRQEVRDGRSFDPNEFAIALEQVVSGKGPEDDRDPEKFFARTSFTRALREHTGMVLRRLAGETQNTPPVLMLITQFGGGKTRTLTALYHLARNGKKVTHEPDIQRLLAEAGLSKIPSSEVAVFVGNAWDPSRRLRAGGAGGIPRRSPTTCGPRRTHESRGSGKPLTKLLSAGSLGGSTCLPGEDDVGPFRVGPQEPKNGPNRRPQRSGGRCLRRVSHGVSKGRFCPHDCP